MPKIDLSPYEGATVEGLVRGPQLSSANQGEGYEAMGRFGADLAQVGEQTLETRKKADDSNYAFSTSMQNQRDIENYAADLTTKVPDGAKGYSAQLGSYIQDKIDQGTANAPSSEAADAYSKSIGRWGMDRMISADNYERTETARKYRGDVVDATTQAASQYMDNPNYLTFKDTADTITKQIQDGVGVNFGAGEASDMQAKAKQQLAVGILEGLGTKERYGEASNLLKSGNPIGDSLDEATKKHYIEKFGDLVDAKQTSSVGEYAKQIDDLKTAALSGRPVNANDVVGLIAKTELNPKVTDDQRNRWKDELNQSLQVGQDIQRIKTMPESQWGTVKSMQVDSGPTEGLAMRMQMQSRFQEQANILKAQRGKDPAGSTLSAFPALQQMHDEALGGDPGKVKSYLDATTAKQEMLGVQTPRVTTPQDAAFLGDIINKAPNSAAAAEAIMGLKNSYGKYFPQMFSELADERKKNGGGVDGGLAVAAFMDSKPGIQSVVENVNNAQGINDLFKQRFAGIGATAPNSLKVAVASQIRPVINALNIGSPLGGNADLSNSLQSQVELEAKKILNNDPSIKIPDAAQQAKAKIIDNNFNTVQGGRSIILAPRNGPNVPDPSLIQKFMAYYSSSDGIEKLDPKIPTSQLQAHDGDKAGAKEAFYENLSKTGQWVTNQDHSGIILTQKIGDGVSLVKDSQGQPIEKKFSDMAVDPFPKDSTISSGSRSLLGYW